MIDKGLGLRIKTFRKNKKMSQQTLADLAGYSDRSMISKIESGTVDLTESKIMAIANALGVTPHYLVGWRTEEEELKMVARNKKPETWDKFNKLSDDKKKVVTDLINLYFDTEMEEEE